MTKRPSAIASLKSLANKQNNKDKKSLATVDISLVKPAKTQDRVLFDDKGIEALAESIKEYGLIEPITVYQLDNGDYEIVAGERRWRACLSLNLETINVIVINRDAFQASITMFLENLGKEKLSPIEIANSLKKRMNDFDLSIQDLARLSAKSTSWVKTHLAFLSYPERTQAIANKKIVTYHDSLRKLKRLELDDLEAFTTLENLLIKEDKRSFSELYSVATGEKTKVNTDDDLSNNKESLLDEDKSLVVGDNNDKDTEKGQTIKVSVKALAVLLTRAERLSKDNAYTLNDKEIIASRIKAIEGKVAK